MRPMRTSSMRGSRPWATSFSSMSRSSLAAASVRWAVTIAIRASSISCVRCAICADSTACCDCCSASRWSKADCSTLTYSAPCSRNDWENSGCWPSLSARSRAMRASSASACCCRVWKSLEACIGLSETSRWPASTWSPALTWMPVTSPPSRLCINCTRAEGTTLPVACATVSISASEAQASSAAKAPAIANSRMFEARLISPMRVASAIDSPARPRGARRSASWSTHFIAPRPSRAGPPRHASPGPSGPGR